MFENLPEIIYILAIFLLFILRIFMMISTLIMKYYIKKRAKIIWLSVLLSQITSAIINLCFIPIIGTLFSVMSYNKEQLTFKSSIKPWSSTHIIILIFGIFSILLYLPIQFNARLLFFETTKAEKKVNSRKITNILFLENVLRLILTIIFVLISNSTFKIWIINFIIAFGYGYLLYVSMKEVCIYYMDFSNTVFVHII